MKNYRKAKKQIEVTVGESLKIIREFQELSQNQLAALISIWFIAYYQKLDEKS